MPPNVTAAIRARSSRLAVIPLVALVLGVLALISGGLAIVNGHFTMSLPIGAVSVKATRPEGLSLSGDGVGCMAVAVLV